MRCRDCETRDRQRPLKVFVTDDERAYILESAAIAGLSVSMYLRVAGMHGRPNSVLDLQAVRDLQKVNADLGRLGGLLKLWLSERTGQGAPAVDVRGILRQVEAAQPEFRRLMLKAYDQILT